MAKTDQSGYHKKIALTRGERETLVLLAALAKHLLPDLEGATIGDRRMTRDQLDEIDRNVNTLIAKVVHTK